jgi:hypothetical protein
MRKALALLLLLSACVVHERVPPPPPTPPPPPRAPAPPPPPSPRLIDERAAVRIAADYARGRGLSVERYKARLDSHGHWRVDLRSTRGDDRARVLVDGYTGRVLKAKLKDTRPDDRWDDDDF